MALFNKNNVLVTGLLLVAALGVKAQVISPPVASTAGFTEYRLNNGLRVLLYPDGSQGSVTVNMTYLVGSRHENYGETGMAHLLEHMLFKGSNEHPNPVQEFAAHGAVINSSSGTTTADRTNYSETMPATPANLEWALRMEADRMMHSLIEPQALMGEMSVVRNEWERNESIPLVLLLKHLWNTGYDWHSYGRDPLGARSDVEHVDIDRLRAFYRTYYQPDNAVLLIAGKFDANAALKLVADAFGRIPGPGRKLAPPRTTEPPQDGERMIIIRRSSGTPLIMVGYHIPAVAHPDSAALEVLLQILGSPEGRLHKAMATQQATGTGGFTVPLAEPGMLTFFTKPASSDLARSVQEIFLKTIETSLTQPPSMEELERARVFLINSHEAMLRSPEQIGVLLSDWIAAGDWRLFFLQQERYKAVTPADVQRVAARYLQPGNRTTALFLQEEKAARIEVPPAPEIAQVLRDFKETAGVTAAEETFDPSPRSIESHLRRYDLPVGLKLAVLPKKTRNNLITAAITLHLGDVAQMKDRSAAALTTLRMLLSGTTLHAKQQIQDDLTARKAGVIIHGDAMAVRLIVQTTPDQLRPVLSLVAESLRQPAFPEEQFEQVRRQTIVALEAQRSAPDSAALSVFLHAITPYAAGDPRYAAALDETIAQMRSMALKDVKQFYSEFYGASNGEMAVIGSVEPEDIHSLVQELLGNWKSASPYVKPPASSIAKAPSQQAVEIADKPNAVVLAGLPVAISVDDSDYAALMLGNYILGGNPLNSRLALRLRQKDALSYSTASVLSVDSSQPEGTFMASATLAPANAGKVEAAIREELDNLLRNGPASEELQTAKAELLQARELTRSRDLELATLLVSHMQDSHTLAWEAELDSRLSALTVQQVTEALRRHIDQAKLTWVKAGSFGTETR